MIKAIISDIDGTLVNTLYFIRHGQYEAMTQYLLGNGLQREQLPTYEQYETCLNQAVGGPTHDTFAVTLQLLAKDFPAIVPGLVDLIEVNDRILPEVQNHLAPLYIHPFPELHDFLKVLELLELKLAIYTSGYDYMVVRNFGVALPSLGYMDLYKSPDYSDADKLQALVERLKATYAIPDMAVVTANDVTAHKPDPEGVLKALDKLGVGPQEAVVLGDHRYDMMAAKAAGVYAIGVSHGFSAPNELVIAGADAVCANLHEVIYHIQYVL